MVGWQAAVAEGATQNALKFVRVGSHACRRLVYIENAPNRGQAGQRAQQQRRVICELRDLVNSLSYLHPLNSVVV